MADGNFFLHENFLLATRQAQMLYHDYVKDLPVIDYHTHLSPEYIAINKKFSNLTEIWLKGDHYKWRALRTAGVDEKFITGDTTDAEKFFHWAKVVPQTIRNPLFHWTHLELKNPFGIEKYLDEKTAEEIYAQCNGLLQKDDFSVISLLKHFKVETVGTTDDPCDDLSHHRLIKNNRPGFLVTPTFRPDAYMQIGEPGAFILKINHLAEISGIDIKDLGSLVEAMQRRVNYFHDNGCRMSDHGLRYLPSHIHYSTHLDKSFQSFLMRPETTSIDKDNFTGCILSALCKMYHEKGWVQQFHLGALRNNNARLQKIIGADSGCDSIGNYQQAEGLSALLGHLDENNQLAKTILYNLNPADNELFATMAGNFNDGFTRGKIQFGSAWWFLDQKDGMEQQINTLSNMGLISTFTGMTTDSRSFLSYSRHEYFRRILCNIFGTEMQNGELPDDMEWIGKILQGICYFNAKTYFNFSYQHTSLNSV